MLTVADNTYVQGAVKTEFVQKLVFSIRHIVITIDYVRMLTEYMLEVLPQHL